MHACRRWLAALGFFVSSSAAWAGPIDAPNFQPLSASAPFEPTQERVGPIAQPTAGGSIPSTIADVQSRGRPADTVIFKHGSSKLQGEDNYKEIRQFGKLLSTGRLQDSVLVIEGHADAKEKGAQKLAEQRARNVFEDLRLHYEIVCKKVVVRSKGSSEPLAATDQLRGFNRRVVIFKEGEGPIKPQVP